MNLSLPHCVVCERAHWPPREICPHCLGGEIAERETAGGGTVLSAAMLHHSLAPGFRDHLPLHVATVALDCGVRAIVFAAGGAPAIGGRVTVARGAGPSGQEALVAKPEPR
jgi:uncharacterized OB-fold protein